nr:hypothetical protein [Tanacetum cinerariifolium]
MSQAAIRKLVADSVAAALETQKATMVEADNSIREVPVAKRGKLNPRGVMPSFLLIPTSSSITLNSSNPLL